MPRNTKLPKHMRIEGCRRGARLTLINEIQQGIGVHPIFKSVVQCSIPAVDRPVKMFTNYHRTIANRTRTNSDSCEDH